MTPLALGLDFGTLGVRALLVALDGREAGSAAVPYAHGQLTDALPSTGAKLPPHFALQHPGDYLAAAAQATRRALQLADADPAAVVGLGVDFTSCTVLPCRADGTPLCLLPRFAGHPHAWPKLWKHHGAAAQCGRINAVARQRQEPWLARYGGVVGLEWLFPKLLEVLEEDAAVYDAADLFLEAGDWFVWQLVGGPATAAPRSTCQAGYKALWSAADGYPTPAFFQALHRDFQHVVRDKLPGRLLAPGCSAGTLTDAAAQRLGLRAGTPVSAAVIDAHAGVPGAGVAEPATLVMVLGTSSCHMLNARADRTVPGVAGVVEGGILPGYFGYETGQAAVGDAFEWFRQLSGQSFDQLTDAAAVVPPGAAGVTCVDWLNGCRTPHMDGTLTGAFLGLTLHHGPAHLYRALLEASAFGVRWIVELLRDGGVPVRRFVATGGLPHHNPLLIQIFADVLGQRITIHPSTQGPALGAAILGVLAAGPAAGFASMSQAIHALARPPKTGPGAALVVHPNRAAHRAYAQPYHRYRAAADRGVASRNHPSC